VERILTALAMVKSGAKDALDAGAVNAQALNAAINDLRKGRTADSAGAEDSYEALKKYARDLTEAARRARSTRSSAATRKSAARCRCCRAAPRTTRC
jgi:ATP-dependent Clp protease ATP-binding subunit ClpB